VIVSGQSMLIVVLAGLMGAPHCLIMCGGISTSFMLNAKKNPYHSALAYHAGRITTYTFTGLLMGLVGSFMNIAGGFVGVQSIASMLGGLLIIAWTYWRYTLPYQHRLWPSGRGTNRFLARLKDKHEFIGTYISGIMLGFLPCGLTYAMQMNAAASGSWMQGAIMLFLFGCSTLPIFIAIALFAGRFGRTQRKGMKTAGAILAYAMGFLSLMKGAAANGWVPSIHPWLW